MKTARALTRTKVEFGKVRFKSPSLLCLKNERVKLFSQILKSEILQESLVCNHVSCPFHHGSSARLRESETQKFGIDIDVVYASILQNSALSDFTIASSLLYYWYLQY